MCAFTREGESLERERESKRKGSEQEIVLPHSRGGMNRGRHNYKQKIEKETKRQGQEGLCAKSMLVCKEGETPMTDECQVHEGDDLMFGPLVLGEA